MYKNIQLTAKIGLLTIVALCNGTAVLKADAVDLHAQYSQELEPLYERLAREQQKEQKLISDLSSYSTVLAMNDVSQAEKQEAKALAECLPNQIQDQKTIVNSLQSEIDRIVKLRAAAKADNGQQKGEAFTNSETAIELVDETGAPTGYELQLPKNETDVSQQSPAQERVPGEWPL